ncbi:hypothetical protein QUF74_13470 [Candidatus Halobeggiatoa sp. HSG11]|nr:hypothetical protein [Candidatus Halobeggiatoa sp. HSG11]
MIQSSSPERRNLIVLSLAIIIYYLAGGNLVNGDIKLYFVNITFARPEVISTFVWIMLCWFCLRFGQMNRGKYTKKHYEEMSTLSYLLNKHVSKQLSISYNEGVMLNMQYTHEGWCIIVLNDIKYQFTGIKGFFVLLPLRIWCVLTKPAFTLYIFPYILFFFAIVVAYLNWVDSLNLVLDWIGLTIETNP